MKKYTNLNTGLKDLRFNHFPYPKDILVYNEEVLFDLVDLFVDQVILNLDNPVKVMLSVCSKDTKDRPSHYYNLTKLIVVTKHNARFILKKHFKSRLDLEFNNYHGAELGYIGLTWGELTYADGSAMPHSPVSPTPYTGKVITDQLTNTSRINLPPTMDISKWEGYKIIVDGKKDKILTNGEYTFTIRIRGIKVVTHYITIYDSNMSVKLYNVIDKSLPRVLNKEGIWVESFRRCYNSNIIEYVGENEVNFTKSYGLDNKGNFITSITKDNNLKLDIITLDLETRVIMKTDKIVEEVFEVVSCAWYDGVNKYCKHILDYNMSVDELFTDIFNSLFLPQNHNKTVYVHNFSKFDGVFLVERLANLVPEDRLNLDFSMITRKDNIICLTITLCGVTLQFKDSYLLLPSSLDKLAKGFNVIRKGEFDFSLNNTVEGLTANKDMLIDYNINDCVVLYEILVLFSKDIFELFKLNITRYSTLPGLAFAIFRSNYMKKASNIPVTSFKTYQDLVQGYTGGHVDVFKPSNPENKQVFMYDINSLYPSEMAKRYYPVGTPTYVELTSEVGEVSNTYFKNKNHFGFYYVDVIAPEHLGSNPLLLKRVGNISLAATGNWSGWYFSEELEYAIRLGYIITPKRAYLYKRGLIFSKYVNTIYDMRLQYPKGHPRNLMCKLLLNSLYGRFGLSPVLTENIIMTTDMAADYIRVNDIEEFKPLGAKRVLVTNQKVNNERLGGYDALNISIGIPFAVSSYGRIAIHMFKEPVKDSLLYSDTDSMHITKLLDPILVGNNLGQMKHEGTAIDAVYLAPKVYCLLMEDGSEICKIKGSKNKLPFDIMKSLLVKGSEQGIPQERWKRSLSLGKITLIADSVYTLASTTEKRVPIYNENGLLVNTKAFKLIDGKLS